MMNSPPHATLRRRPFLLLWMAMALLTSALLAQEAAVDPAPIPDADATADSEATDGEANETDGIDWETVTPAGNVPPRFQPLIDNSPFITPAFRERMLASRARGRSRVVFHGYARLGDEWVFSLLNSGNGQHYLLPIDKEEDGIRITRFDEKEETIHLIVNGNATELKINPL